MRSRPDRGRPGIRLLAFVAAFAVTCCSASPGWADEATGVAAGAPDPCASGALSVRIRVRNVSDSRGTITVDLHDDRPEQFLHKQIARVRVPATVGETVVCVPVERPGTYAVALYQDRNSNLHLDKTFLGIPSEPVGVSNDPPFRLRAPRFDEAAFAVSPQGADLVITLHELW